LIMRDYEHVLRESSELNEAFIRLYNLIKILRVECPWDKEQTHESLVSCMKEEAYEVIEAISKKDIKNLREELGDVLLQVVFHGIIAEELSEFELIDVINQECEKMIRRHPHVFQEKEDKTIDKVLKTWEDIKCNEHLSQNQTERLKGVPKALPALIRSSKVQKKARESGFDWEDVNGALDKINEETKELIEAINANDNKNIEEEIGDLLFAVVNASRFLKVNPEEALVKTTEKFIRRYEFIENNADKRMEDMSLDEMDSLWDEAKKKGL